MRGEEWLQSLDDTGFLLPGGVILFQGYRPLTLEVGLDYRLECTMTKVLLNEDLFNTSKFTLINNALEVLGLVATWHTEHLVHIDEGSQQEYDGYPSLIPVLTTTCRVNVCNPTSDRLPLIGSRNRAIQVVGRLVAKPWCIGNHVDAVVRPGWHLGYNVCTERHEDEVVESQWVSVSIHEAGVEHELQLELSCTLRDFFLNQLLIIIHLWASRCTLHAVHAIP